jgi:hypothetical protein
MRHPSRIARFWDLRQRSSTEARFNGLVNVRFNCVYFLARALLPLIAHGGQGIGSQ